MKRVILFFYSIIHWLTLFILLVTTLLLFIAEQPSFVLALASEPLKKQGISYGHIKGGVLSGLKIEDINYQDKLKLRELKLKIYWERLQSRLLYIDRLTLDGIEIEEKFLASLIDSNSSSDEENTTLPFDKVVINQANISIKDTSYKNYKINSAKLEIKNLTTDMKKQYKGDISLLLDSSVAQLDLNGSIENESVKLLATLEPERAFIEPFVADNNITFNSNPLFSIKADGDMKKINYHITTHRLGIKQNEFQLDSNKLILYGNYGVSKKEIDTTIKTDLKGSMANLKLDAKVGLNLDDINSSLSFNIDAHIAPKKEFVESKMVDNISIQRVANIDINATGDLHKTKFRVSFSNFQAKKEDISLKVQSMLLTGLTNPLQGDTNLYINTDINSTIGFAHIEDNVSLNFNQLNSSLKYNTKIDIDANSHYLNSFIEEQNITILDSPKINLQLHGGMEDLIIEVDIESHLDRKNQPLKVTLKSNPISLDLKEHNIDGNFKLLNSSKKIDLILDSEFHGDYMQPKKIESSSRIVINKFNDFGFDLEPLMPMSLKAKTSENGASLRVNSNTDSDKQKLKLYTKTKDYDQFLFDIDTEKLYLYKMMELPKGLNHKFVKLDMRGSATLSKEFLKLKANIGSNQNFKALLNIENSSSGLNAKVETKELKATVRGDLKEKNLKAEVETQSLEKLQRELNKIYRFNRADIDGALRVDAKVKGEEIWAEINSTKLILNGFNIEDIALDAHYNQELLTLNKLNFKTTGFKDKKINKEIYLNQPGKIYLGERRDILLDIHPNILVKAEGSKNSLNAKVKIDRLPLGHPDYGSMFLSCDIDYIESGQNKSIKGNIDMAKMKLFYEAKFLEADYDPDIVIITKKDKDKKERADDSFLKYTAIDLNINAHKAKYKTQDIGLLFDINLRANKVFGKELKLLGKIEEIDGHVDQTPKRYDVKTSNIVFTGGKKINPLLDIHVEYQLPQVLIQIGIGGNANRPKINFSSEPPMPKKDILSYLLLGVSTANLGKGGSTLSREAELFILNQAARDLAYDVELDRLFIKDDGTGEGFAIETGKKISKKNMFILETTKEGNSFILEHDVSKNIKLRVGQHQKELPSQSLDIYFRKRFK